MEDKQEDKFLEEFILHDMRAEDPMMLKKIRRAWSRVKQKGKELGKWSCIAKDPYCQWLRERVQKIKLPYIIEIPT